MEIRCILCGSTLLEGAHVEPRRVFDDWIDDRLQNIIWLCPICHILFDRGFITIHPEYRIFVFSFASSRLNIFRKFGHAYAHSEDLMRIPEHHIRYHLEEIFLREFGEKELEQRFIEKPKIQRLHRSYFLSDEEGDLIDSITVSYDGVDPSV